jgi:diguanylate cyclase (GGDEF)-like protein/PAS domain S-box-containing protein
LFGKSVIRAKKEIELADAEEYGRLMLGSIPLGCQIWDKDLNIVDCNAAAVRMFGLASKDEYLERFHELSPEYQPDGQPSYERSRAYIEQAFEEGVVTTSWMHQLPDGTPLPVEVTLIKVPHKGDYVVAGYTKDVSEVKDLEEKAEAVYFDALTGIHNRRYLNEVLDHLIRTQSRSHSALSVMMIDIDYFKRYNDAYGHAAGDECLISIAETLSESMLRADDFVARYGGEEFTIVLPFTNESGAVIIAERLLKSVQNLRIPHGNSDAADCVTISIGVTTGSAQHTQTGTDYLKRSDEALYLSKHGGRNKVTFLPLDDA